MRHRRTQSALRVLGGSLLVGCGAAWLVGHMLSDRYAWSQPVSWVPAPARAAPVWLGLVVMLGGRRRRRGRDRRRGGPAPVRSLGPSCVLAAVGLFSLVTAGHLAFVELGLQRAVIRPAGEGAPLRLIFWNQAGREAGDISPIFLGRDPTLFLLANRHSRTPTRGLAQAFIDTGEAHAAVGWPFDLFSRLPITRWASASLDLDGRSRTADAPTRPDPGWAAWFEVESAGGPLVIWAIDLPSDPGLARMPLAQQAGRAIAGWTGSARDERGGVVPMAAGAVGFPAPDLIVGDFNIPRGSASLGAFLEAAGAPGMRNAFDLAGAGWQRTWPRETPVWAIDQCFVGERVAARSLHAFDPGVGGHRALEVVVEPNPAAR